jgi:hypothetical protein
MPAVANSIRSVSLFIVRLANNRLCCVHGPPVVNVLIARMKQHRKRTLPSAHDRICPDMPEFLVSNLLRGQAKRIIRPLPGAFKFVL